MIYCNHCEEPVEPTEIGMMNCPHCNWPIIVKMEDLFYSVEKYYPDSNKIKGITTFNSLNGSKHNDKGPSEIGYFINGNVWFEKYYFNNKCHRIDGPAIVWYDSSGGIRLRSYYINGTKLSFKQFNAKVSTQK